MNVEVKFNGWILCKVFYCFGWNSMATESHACFVFTNLFKDIKFVPDTSRTILSGHFDCWM